VKTLPHVTALVVASLALSGCALLPSGPPRISLDAFELEAESLAFDLTGLETDVECGDGSIDLVVGAEAECVMSDPDSSDQLTVTFGVLEVRASDDFQLEVVDFVEPEGTPESEHPTVPSSEIEELAAGSLAQQGIVAAVLCSDDTVEVFEGTTFRCGLVYADGGFGEAAVSIIDFDGSSYSVVAAVVE